MPSSVQRKLAAIMFTDIADFTALSAKDETKALTLLDLQKDVLTPIIKEFNGTLHKEIGDGLLFTFSTVTEAVKCGIKIQEVSKSVDDLNLRIGIHEGEITLKDGDALGDDVNITSRIFPYSPIGGIALSRKVQQNISSLPEFKTILIGNPKLKGVPQKTKIYCLSSHELQTISKPGSISISPGWIGGIGLVIVLSVFFFKQFVIQTQESNSIEFVADPSITILQPENISDLINKNIIRTVAEDLIIKISSLSGGEIILPSIKEVLSVNENLPRKIAKKLNSHFVLESSLIFDKKEFELRCRLLNTKTGKSLYSKTMKSKQENLPVILEIISIGIIKSLNIDVINYPQEIIPVDLSLTL